MIDSMKPTESLCPVCLSTVPAMLLAEGEDVLLEGKCPKHGSWRTRIWAGPPSWESWCGEAPTGAAGPAVDEAEPGRPVDTDCPGACGLCARHRQRTCTAVLEVTQKCDLGCRFCFAESAPDGSMPGGSMPDLPLADIAEALRRLYADQGAVNLQLSGGEPTTRDDLPGIIRTARAAGFSFVQLNTNGLRLASQTGYAETLRDAGLVSVFLQFDGVTDETYRALRGRPLASTKLRALERCARAGLAVVLVPTVVPGINDQELGSLVRLAAEWAGVVRGLHLQPVSYFGRYPDNGRPRLTLPEVLRLLEHQTGGVIKTGDFSPSSCEHVRCSFRARYWVRDGGRLEPLKPERTCCRPAPADDAAQRAIAATSLQWSRRSPRDADRRGQTGDGLGRFLEETSKILAVSGMLFQDAWCLDLERVRQCCVHELVPGRGLVPFCLWNLTSASGHRLYPYSPRATRTVDYS